MISVSMTLNRGKKDIREFYLTSCCTKNNHHGNYFRQKTFRIPFIPLEPVVGRAHPVAEYGFQRILREELELDRTGTDHTGRYSGEP